MNRRITALAAATLVLAACSDATDREASERLPQDGASETPSVEAPSVEAPSADQSPSQSPEPTADPSELTILSGGDILLHLSVTEGARTGPNTYDYAPYYEEITDWIDGADLSICALEVPIVGEDEAPSNYPNFGAPKDLADSLDRIGFDGCAVATNHTMDRGFHGVTTTIEALEESGLGWAGSARSQEEADEIQFYTLESGGRDVKIAHLSATTLTNGIPIPGDHPYSWDVVGELGDPVSAIIDDAERARELGADLVVLSMHWGTEYVNEPITEQLEIADELAASGEIDLIFGNHSHVPQPVVELEGGPRGEGMWVVWSMGNQISGQTVANHGYRVTTGLMTTATVDVPAEGPATVAKLDWTVVTQDRPAGERLYLLNELLDANYPVGMTMGAQEIRDRADVTYPVMAGSGPERTQAPTPSASSITQSRE